MNAQHSTENLTIHHKVEDYGTWRKSFKLWVALAFMWAIVIAVWILFLSADESDSGASGDPVFVHDALGRSGPGCAGHRSRV